MRFPLHYGGRSRQKPAPDGGERGGRARLSKAGAYSVTEGISLFSADLCRAFIKEKGKRSPFCAILSKRVRSIKRSKQTWKNFYRFKEIRPDVDFANEQDLIGSGILDSLDIMEIVAEIGMRSDHHSLRHRSRKLSFGAGALGDDLPQTGLIFSFRFFPKLAKVFFLCYIKISLLSGKAAKFGKERK